MKINVVTGWPVPQTDEEQNVLSEQLKLYLNENWPLFNVQEIMYAMRSYATVLNNWGKNMNLSLIGKAISDYEAERIEVSKLEETRKPQNTNLITMKADWRPLLELYYQDYLKGTFNMRLMPVEVYGAAMELNYMSADAWEDWEQTAKELLLQQLHADKFEAMHENERQEIENKISNILEGYTEPIDAMAKKLAIEFLYQQAKKKGIKNLFK